MNFFRTALQYLPGQKVRKKSKASTLMGYPLDCNQICDACRIRRSAA
jgi:hypothetical protein